MITRETIDKVFETARVEEVIGDFVQLKRAGSNYKGLSPFSDERSPSFMVSPVKQIWKDFSSGKGGSVVTFLMEHEHFTYPEAIRFLANKYNIEIEETEQSQEDKLEANEKESMYLVSEFAKTYFHDTLLNSEEGKAIGLSYFKERGFTNEDEIEITIPDGFVVEAKPNGIEQENEFGYYKIEFSALSTTKILCKRKLVIKKGFYDKSKYENYRKFRETIAKNDNSKIVITKA